MDQASRFTFSGPGSWPLERVIQFAVEQGFSRVDFNSDNAPNYPGTFAPERTAAVRKLVEEQGVRLGIHTSSAVNMAELTPVMSAAADEYLRQNFDLIKALGGAYLICHGGYHFGSDYEARCAAGLARMQRAVELAEARAIDIYFENHNWEPEHAEIHYLPHNLAETRRFFETISSPRFKWAANVGHAELVPERFDAFLDLFGADRIGQVRLHDTHGQFEEHLLPGEGLVDFHHVFRRLTQLGYSGPFTLDFGGPDERVQWRTTFAQWLAEVSA